MKYTILYTYADIQQDDADAQDPPLWEIKHPFHPTKTKYVTRHQAQLKTWWGPLKQQYKAHFANYNSRSCAITSVRYSPQLGLAMVIRSTKKETISGIESTIIDVLDAAKETWAPTKIEKDPMYSYRQKFIYWTPYVVMLLGMAIVATIIGHDNHTYITSDGSLDIWYAVVGLAGAFLITIAATVYLKPRLEKHPFTFSIWATTCGLASFATAVLIGTSTFNLNGALTKAVCIEDVKVTSLSKRGSKGKSYYATVNIPQVCNLNVDSLEVHIQRQDYEMQPKVLNITLHRGFFGRFFIETRPLAR